MREKSSSHTGVKAPNRAAALEKRQKRTEKGDALEKLNSGEAQGEGEGQGPSTALARRWPVSNRSRLTIKRI